MPLFRFILLAVSALPAFAQTADQVLVVANRKSAASREIADYYVRRRAIPLTNLCAIETAPEETIGRAIYDKEVEAPIGEFLKAHDLREKILYIVLTKDVPLRIQGNGRQLQNDAASVDSELTLLYQRLRGISIPVAGAVNNPFFGQRDTPFRHPVFPIYLVTRLDGYDMRDVKALVDRSLEARNTGKFVIDLKARETNPGNGWLRTAAFLLPKDRVTIDETDTVLTGIENVIAYAAWGSNDTSRKRRFLGFKWLPGAIATEFVSTDARTFHPPPETWQIGTWDDNKTWFAGSPQSLTADYIREGASGASGQVDEPYLSFCPRPEFVLPAYYSGRNLAESFYMGIPGLSWMNVVVGDPLMHLKP